MYQEKGLYLKYAKAIKEVVDVPILCTGRLEDPDMSSKAARDGWIERIAPPISIGGAISTLMRFLRLPCYEKARRTACG